MNVEPSGPPPPVWTWYRAYCVFMTLVYLACVVVELVLRVLDPSHFGEKAIVMRIQGAMLVMVGGVLMAAFGAGPLLPHQPWVWIYGLVLICIGLTSCCCLPASLPLLIFWTKPETKLFFGRAA